MLICSSCFSISVALKIAGGSSQTVVFVDVVLRGFLNCCFLSVFSSGLDPKLVEFDEYLTRRV